MTRLAAPIPATSSRSAAAPVAGTRKRIARVLAAATFGTAAALASQPVAAACPPLLDHKANRLQDDAPQDLCAYSGKVVLVVNTASKCGNTPQFEGLEKLNARYADRGLVVLGFPSNDFKQEEADRSAIGAVCFDTYGVKFPMFAPAPVKGEQAQPLFAELARKTGVTPGWNFHKYLVGRDGASVKSFSARTKPDDPALVSAIEAALKTQN